MSKSSKWMLEREPSILVPRRLNKIILHWLDILLDRHPCPSDKIVCPLQKQLSVLMRTVCPLPRNGRFPSALPATTRSTGVSTQPPTNDRLCFCRFMRCCKQSLSVTRHARPDFCLHFQRNFFYEDHSMLVMILCTVRKSFPCQLLFQCWDPYDILHWTFHTDTFCLNKHTQGK